MVSETIVGQVTELLKDKYELQKQLGDANLRIEMLEEYLRRILPYVDDRAMYNTDKTTCDLCGNHTESMHYSGNFEVFCENCNGKRFHADSDYVGVSEDELVF